MGISLFLPVSWYLLDSEICIVHYCSLGHSEDFCRKCCHLLIHCLTFDDFQGHSSQKKIFSGPSFVKGNK